MRCDVISREELPGLIQWIRTGYIEQKVAEGGWNAEDAEKSADEELAGLFPDDDLREGHELYIVREDDAPEGGDPIGHLWIGVLRQMSNTLFIYDIEIRPAAQGRGLGRAVMAFAEERARALGCTSVALHVFGGNEAAIGLYRSLGYKVTDLNLRKDLISS